MSKHFELSIGGLPLPGTIPISLGSKHPSHAGAIRLWLATTDDVITCAKIQPGYLHRAAEKLFEVRDWRSVIALADRHDWLSSFSGELLVAHTIENAMGIQVPTRAQWLRATLCEISRIHSHLSFLTYISNAVWSVVEELRSIVLHASGNRVHPMLNRVGGLAHELDEAWLARLAQALVRVRAVAQQIRDEVPERFIGLAVTDAALCRDFALSGPVARAAGIDLDLRPSLGEAWAVVHEPTPIRTSGDAHARFHVLLDELDTSATMIERLIATMPSGPVAVKLSRRLKVPEGEHVADYEAPWGRSCVLLVSRGGTTPWRLALRTPTFANVSALEQLLVGCTVNRICDVIASMGYAIGDLDK